MIDASIAILAKRRGGNAALQMGKIMHGIDTTITHITSENNNIFRDLG